MTSSIPILEIDLKKICANYRQFLNKSPVAKLASMVKADAYGLGAVRVTKALIQEGCENFFVANSNEALTLRRAFPDDNIKLYVLNGVFDDDIEKFYKYNLIPVLNHMEQIKLWQNFATNKNQVLPAILHVNTGMYRLGLPLDEIELINKNKKLISNIKLEYIMSHLTCSEYQSSLNNVYQLNNFKKIIAKFPNTKASLVNSCGVLLGSEYHFDMLRVGAGLYGIGADPNNPSIAIQNPIKLLAPIIQIQRLEQATPIGYNRTFVTDRPAVIATLGLGYADGYSRSYSNKGFLYIEDYKVPIVGIISMDLMTVNVSLVPDDKVFLGQMVEVIGPHITPDKLAKTIDTIGYEIITLLSKRYRRIYKS